MMETGVFGKGFLRHSTARSCAKSNFLELPSSPGLAGAVHVVRAYDHNFRLFYCSEFAQKVRLHGEDLELR